MKKHSASWLEGTLSCRGLEPDTLPLVFSPREDLDVYFSVLATQGRRCVQRLEEMKQCYVIAREQHAAGHLVASSQSLIAALVIRRGVFVATDYQVTAAAAHLVLCTAQYASFEIARLSYDTAYRLLGIAAKAFKENFTSPRPPALDLVLQNAMANYWHRRRKGGMVARCTEACLRAWRGLGVDNANFDLYLKMRHVSALCGEGNYRMVLEHIPKIPTTSSAYTGGPSLDITLGADHVRSLTLWVASDDTAVTATTLGCRECCEWLVAYSVGLSHAGLHNYTEALAAIASLTPNTVNHVWGANLLRLRSWIEANQQGAQVSKYRMPREELHHPAYRQLSKFVAKFAFGGGSSEGATVTPPFLADRERAMTPMEYITSEEGRRALSTPAHNKTQEGDSSRVVDHAPTTPVMRNADAYLEMVLAEALEEARDRGATPTFRDDDTAEGLALALASVEADIACAKETAAVLREAAQRQRIGTAPAKVVPPREISTLTFTDRILAMQQVHNLGNSDALHVFLAKHPGQEHIFLQTLIKKYGAERGGPYAPFSPISDSADLTPPLPHAQPPDVFTVPVRKKDHGVALHIGISEGDEDAVIDAFYHGAYRTSSSSRGPLLSDSGLKDVSAVKRHNLVPGCRDLERKQRVLQSMLPSMRPKEFTYRLVQMELSENGAILAAHRRRVNDIALKHKAVLLSKTMSVLRALSPGHTEKKFSVERVGRKILNRAASLRMTHHTPAPVTVFDCMKGLWCLAHILPPPATTTEEVAAPSGAPAPMQDVAPPTASIM